MLACFVSLKRLDPRHLARLIRGRSIADAERLARHGKHERAFRLLARAARAGRIEAQTKVGIAYLQGRGTLPSLPAALYWLRKAAEAGEATAQESLASLAAIGVTCADANLFSRSPAIGPPDFGQVLRWAEPAAKAGKSEAKRLVAFVKEHGPVAMRDPEAAEALYAEGAEGGNAQAQLGLGAFLLRDANPDGLQARRQRAKVLLEQAAAADASMAHHLLALLAETAIPSDPAEALRRFRAAAERDYAPAQYRLGKALIAGEFGSVDAFDGETWLRRAALGGETEAAKLLGDLYAKEEDRPPNLAEASMWYRRAAEQGHAAAACALGRLHLSGPLRDVTEAAEWLRMAVNGGDAAARDHLAALARDGLVPPSDQRATFEWFREIAETGLPAAWFNLGLCWLDGIGTLRDDIQALACFHLAAPTMPEAMYWQGRMFAEGRGCTPDETSARACYLMAAEAGFAEAKAAAGEMLVNARGGPRDLPLALTLFADAASAGHEGAARALRLLGGSVVQG